MRILFYSNSCNFCLKLVEYIEKNNLKEYFKMINIDTTNNIPKNITIVPTIIDTTIEAPLEGKKAFEYVINQKYFNHPTNNVDFIKNGVPKPTIEEDSKANVSKNGAGFIYVDNELEKKFVDKDDKNNFDNVFSSRTQLTHNTPQNNTPQNNTQQNTTQQKSTPKDPYLENLMHQRNMQDKKLATLMRLRGNM